MGIEAWLGTKEVPFRTSYVKLDKPYPVKGSVPPKETYSCVALLPKGFDLGPMKKAGLAALEAKFPGKAEAVVRHPKFKTPFKDQSELINTDGEQNPGTEAGAIFINMSSQLPPLVVGMNGKPIQDPRDFYSGCYAIAKVDIYAWDHPTGGRGVTVGLLGIQKVADGDPLGGSAARAEVSDFEPISTAKDAAGIFGDDDEIPF